MAINRSREDWKVYANVFDKFTINIIRKLSSQGYFNELTNTIAMGKEANVFLASKKDGSHVIVKIYRLENCNFNKMVSYLRQDPRYINIRKSKRNTVFNWVQREYRNLLLAREVIKVPTPIAVKNNVVVMEFIGDDFIAPELKDSEIEDYDLFLKKILKNIKLLWNEGLVHGDLSAFNILNYHNTPIFIDFSQGTVTSSYDAKDLLLRDLNNIANFFSKKKVYFDVDKEFNKIIKKNKK
jgi:RIO kinase 1